MPITDPYRPDVEVALREPVRHLHKVTAYAPGQDPYEYGVVLDLVTATLDIDEDTTPRFRFNGAVGLVEDQATLDLLDPRKGTRFFVEVGYRYADGRTELRPIADLVLVERVVRRPQGDVVLVAESDERLVMDYVGAALFAAGTAKTTAVAALLSQGHSQPVTLLASSLRGSLVEELRVEPDGVWSALQSLLDEASTEAYHDGLTGFFVTDQPTLAGAAATSLTTGRTGTITASEAALDRVEFANYVMVRYRWRDAAGVDQSVYGTAEQVDGPYGTAAVGRVGRVVEVERRGTVANATAQALGILYRTISRGRRLHVEDATARYWLRPGMAVDIRLPLGDAERALISRVTFNVPAGSMSVHTRQPEYVSVNPPL